MHRKQGRELDKEEAMQCVEMRAVEDQGDRADLAASSIPMQLLNILEEVIQAEAHVPQIRVRLRTGNPSEAERDEPKASHLQLSSWGRDVAEIQMEQFFTNWRNCDRMISIRSSSFGRDLWNARRESQLECGPREARGCNPSSRQ